jgi:hypothetical protein
LLPVVVDLTSHRGETALVRVVDASSQRDGVIRFDEFRLHSSRPEDTLDVRPSGERTTGQE